MSEHPLLRVDEILQVLVEEAVDFVLIGGLAAQVHGSPSLTGDIDICHSLDRDNLDRLGRALERLAAVRRMPPPNVDAPVDVRALRSGDMFTLTTRFGDLDLRAHPDPDMSYERLRAGSISAEILGVTVRAASLDDLIAMKRAAGRPKDRVELEILGACAKRSIGRAEFRGCRAGPTPARGRRTGSRASRGGPAPPAASRG